MIERTYTQARADLAELMDRATQDRETIIIQRRGHEPVAMIAADELRGMRETLHLLRSPTNAARLLTALEDTRAGHNTTPTTLETLRATLDHPDQ